jgi:uncharacterized protein YecE (DUF72 family)
MTQYLIGTGGWSYFKVPGKDPLAAYTKLFNFVETNYTFYQYPDTRTVERWRRTTPQDFTFAVRCHQDLSHRIRLKPTDDAHPVLAKMTQYCEILDSPFLVLETPANYTLNKEHISEARTLLTSANLHNIQLVWETRAQTTPAFMRLMSDMNIVHSVDLSREKPKTVSDVVYSRLFGKGKHNLYQFTDEELKEIDERALGTRAKTIVMAYHGLRMNTDAARFKEYKNTGTFLPVTSFVGIDSAKAVLAEDANFPASKADLIETQGWKVIDFAKDRRVHLSELLSRVLEKTYNSLPELVKALEAVL